MADKPKSNVKRLRRTPRILRDDDAECSQEPAPVCSFCDKPLGEVGYLVGSGAAKICEACIDACAALIRTPRDGD